MLTFDFNRDPPRRPGILAEKRITEETLIPLLSSWSVLDENGLAWAIAPHDPSLGGLLILKVF